MNFFKKPDPAKEMRKQTQDLRRAQREIERTKHGVEKQEKELEMEIKKAAKLGNNDACKIYAKQLVQLRKQKTRIVTAGSQVASVTSHTKVLQANSKLASVMGTTAKTMTSINKQMDPSQVAKTMQEFEKENSVMDMKGEMLDDALASALDHSDDEEEQDAVVNKVLDEIGIEIAGKLAEAPSAKGGKITDSEIEAQLAKLKIPE